MEVEEATDICTDVIDSIAASVVAEERFLETVLSGVLAKGHVLMEDVPGTGKTLTARSFANALNLSFSRIQFTPDLLPSDITGSNIFNEETNAFEFAKGPVFANIVLADEINRAPPKTQAALLEAMAEGQVTIDGDTYTLPEPFFVIATQNPIEQEGTFRLPEAQRDRFVVKTEMGYPDKDGTRLLLDRRANRGTQIPAVEPVIESGMVTRLQETVEGVRMDDDVRDYIVDLGHASREDDRVDVGVSPRGIQRLYEVAKAAAVLEGRDYLVPDDVKRMARPTFQHRLVLTAEATVRGVQQRDVVDDLLDSVEVPAVTQ